MNQTAQQDYLKAIYQSGGVKTAVSTSQLAERLNVRAASVTHMLKKLSKATPPLIAYKKHRGATLTAAGQREALILIRQHRLIETFLCEKLNFSWDEVHEEAERLEHAISPEFVEKIAQSLGHPAHDPHGQPIPSAALEIANVDERPLSTLTPNETATITRVRDEDAALLRYFAECGLWPGTAVTVKAKQPNGTIQLWVDKTLIKLQPHMLAEIFITNTNNSVKSEWRSETD